MAYVVFCEQIVILGLCMVDNVVVKIRTILSQNTSTQGGFFVEHILCGLVIKILTYKHNHDCFQRRVMKLVSQAN